MGEEARVMSTYGWDELTDAESAKYIGIGLKAFREEIKPSLPPRSKDRGYTEEELADAIRLKFLNARPGRIYFIQGQGVPFIKIGYAKNIEKRRADLQTSSPYPLIVIGSFHGTQRDESFLHHVFYEIRGPAKNEWFHEHPILLDLATNAAPPAWIQARKDPGFFARTIPVG